MRYVQEISRCLYDCNMTAEASRSGAGNGVAGLGWNVSLGPTVTRSIQGNPDEEGYLIYNPDFGSWDTSYMHKMTRRYGARTTGCVFYSTFDAQGNFVFRRPEKSSESGSHIPVYLPLTSDKVETSDIRSGFQVTDGSGNIYRFKEAEYSNVGERLLRLETNGCHQSETGQAFLSYVTQKLTYADSYDYYAVETWVKVTKLTGYWQG